MTDASTATLPLSATAAERHRPRARVVAPANWLNDPNGLIQRNGVYHLFYQYNPHNPRSETKHWGHVSSPDLVHWTHRPIALAPVPGSPDADGVYSGCAVDRGDEVLLMYTGVAIDANGVERQLPCVATSRDDDLVSWTRHLGNPVIRETPPGLDLVFYRDHTVWREGDWWYMGIASRIRDVGGAVLLYRSTNLYDWEYLHPLAVGNLDRSDPHWAGTGWECPDYVNLGDQRVLIVSGHDDHPINVVWLAGDEVDHRLQPRRSGFVDGGPSFYAPQSFTDGQGRRVMFGWLRERRSVAAQVAAGWSGAMTLPRVLSLDGDGALVTAPAPENALLRTRELEAIVTATGATSLAGETIELVVTFDAGSSEPVGLQVRANADGSEVTRITYEPGARALVVDTRASSIDPAVFGTRSMLPVPDVVGDEATLRVYLDRSVVEVFLNDRVCVSDRLYPADPGSTGISVIGADRLVALRAWEIGDAFAGGA